MNVVVSGINRMPCSFHPPLMLYAGLALLVFALHFWFIWHQAVDYRGYGNSSGTPSEAGLVTDAHTILRYCATKPGIDRSKIILFGRSLGGAVCVALAASAEKEKTGMLWRGDTDGSEVDTDGVLIRGIILENTFTSVADMSASLFPVVKPIKFLLPVLLRNKWETLSKVSVCANALDIMVP